MYTIVPIIMAIGVLVFSAGIIIYVRLGYNQIKSINVLGKEYTLGRFVITTIGSGILLIMLSIMINNVVPYTAEPESQSVLPSSAVKSDFELELMLSDIKSDSMTAYVQQFQQEYQEALQRGDDSTIGLLRMEFTYRIRTELEDQGYEASRLEQEVQRIIERLPQQP